MKIASVAAAFPERIVTNAEIIEMIRERSQKTFDGDLQAGLDKIAAMLKTSGAEEKRWLRPDEAFFPHVEQAVEKALDDAAVRKSDIDLLIYASVDKRVLEPATASLVAGALGMNHVQCFDVSEACNGWSRATQIASLYLQAKLAKNVMIITAEFNAHENHWGEKNYTLAKADDIHWAFATYTVGESATATILTADENDWDHTFVGRPEHANLCFVPLDNYPKTSMQYNHFDMRGYGAGKFISHSKDLSRAGWKILSDFLLTSRQKISMTDVVFPHNHSKKYWLDMAESLQMDIPFYFSYPKYGNLVSGSIPASMALAIADNTLKRNNEVFVIMGAAGLAFSIYSFRY